MQRCKLIDFENHYVPAGVVDFVAGRKTAPRYDRENGLFYMQEGEHFGLPMMPGLFGVEQRIADMDSAGIDIAVISGAPMVEQMESEFALTTAQISNNDVADMQRRFPDRIRGYASIPVHDTKEAVEELRRCKEELGLSGWLTFSNSGTMYADDDEMFPIFEEAARLGMFVYIHPAHCSYHRLYGCGSGMTSAGLGFTMDACVGITRMITKGLFDRLPDLKVIIGHLGEGIPFIMDRMDAHIGGQGNPHAWENIHEPSWYFKRNIWVTTGGNNSPEAFECAKQVLGVDRILFSTDYPFEPIDQTMKAYAAFRMTEEERERVSAKNGLELLGMF